MFQALISLTLSLLVWKFWPSIKLNYGSSHPGSDKLLCGKEIKVSISISLSKSMFELALMTMIDGKFRRKTGKIKFSWRFFVVLFILISLISMSLYSKQGYALKNWVEGLSDEAFYPWESPKKIRLKSVSPTFATKQKKVSIHR